jgi:polysaccharide export outer membrane protein
MSMSPQANAKRMKIGLTIAGALLCLCLPLVGCGGDPPAEPPSDLGTASLPIAETASLSDTSYLIQPGDDIEVKFTLTPELNERQIVRPDGRISMQSVHPDLLAAGKTVDALEAALGQAYLGQLRDPDITVLVRAYGGNRIYVGGEVTVPGVLPLNGPTTAFEAILQAQGFKDTAWPAQVILFRQAGGGKWRTIDLSQAPMVPRGPQDVLLQPRDVLYVPRSPIANVGRFVDLYIRRLLPIAPSIQMTP